MITGYNHNIRHNNRVYHVQTEDSGRQYAHIITHLFVGGNIISSKKTSYQDLLGKGLEETALEDGIRELMKEQHKTLIRELKAGDHDAVGEFKSEGTLLTPGIMQRPTSTHSSATLKTLDPSALTAAAAALQTPPTKVPSSFVPSASSASLPSVSLPNPVSPAPSVSPASSGRLEKGLTPPPSPSALPLSSEAKKEPKKERLAKDGTPAVSGDTYETVLTVEDMMEEEDFIQLTKKHDFTQNVAAFRPLPPASETKSGAAEKPSAPADPKATREAPALDEALTKAFAEMDALLGPPSEMFLSTPTPSTPSPNVSSLSSRGTLHLSPPPPSASADSLEIPLEQDDVLDEEGQPRDASAGDRSGRGRINRERPSFRAPRPPRPKGPPRTSIPETRTDEDLPQFQAVASISASDEASVPDLPWQNLLSGFFQQAQPPAKRSKPSLQLEHLQHSPQGSWKVQIQVAPTPASSPLPRPASTNSSHPIVSLIRQTLGTRTARPDSKRPEPG